MRGSAGFRYGAVISLYSAHNGTVGGPLVYCKSGNGVVVIGCLIAS